MTTPCPDIGTLRAHLDGEAPAATGVTGHARDCPRCAAELARLQADAEVATRALALLAPGAAAPPAAQGPGELGEHRHERRRSIRAPARRVAAAAAVAAVVLATLSTPAGREAAASFLAQFRSERIEVVSIEPTGGGNPLAALHELGTVDADPQAGTVVTVGSLAEAERRTGLEPPAVPAGAVPSSFDRQPPQVSVADAAEVRVAFDTARVRAWLERHGSDLDVPAGLDGTVLAVQLPPAVALVYRGPDFEQLAVGRSGLVTATTEGPLGLEELRAFLLELPGLPPGVADQLRAIDDWRTTLPLPVPARELDWRDTTVGGVPAVELEGTSGFGSALLWQRDGVVHGVGGLVDEDTVRRIAESLVP